MGPAETAGTRLPAVTRPARLLKHLVPLAASLNASEIRLVPSLPVSRSRSGDGIDPRGSLGYMEYVAEVMSLHQAAR